MLSLDASAIKATLKDAAETVRQQPPVKKYKNVSYAIAVKTGYEEIKKLRDDGYGFDRICEALVSKGILDGPATPKNLGRVFLRETKRRSRGRQENNKTGKEGGGIKPAAANKTAQSEREAREQERLKDLTGSAAEAGTGGIRKLPNGSFDF